MLRYQLVAIVARQHGLDSIERILIDNRVVLAVINGVLMFDLAYEHGVLEQEPQWSLTKADIADGTTRLEMSRAGTHAAHIRSRKPNQVLCGCGVGNKNVDFDYATNDKKNWSRRLLFTAISGHQIRARYLHDGYALLSRSGVSPLKL